MNRSLSCLVTFKKKKRLEKGKENGRKWPSNPLWLPFNFHMKDVK